MNIEEEIRNLKDGYILSTISIPFIKKLWLTKNNHFSNEQNRGY
jgi:hypothetical protein